MANDVAKELAALQRMGVAALRHGGCVLVALVSDDNHALTQRSLLLLFELVA